jgi:adenylate kinase
MSLIVLAPLGVESRTRAAWLADAIGVPLIDLGALVRTAAATQTPLGLQVQATLDAGALVSDDLVLGLLEQRLGVPDAQVGFLLDNYPRDIVQAQALDTLLTRLQQPVDAAVQLEDEGSLHQRLAGDDDGIMRARFDEQQIRHEAVAEHYRAQGKLIAFAELSAKLSLHDHVGTLAWSPDARTLAISAVEGGFPGVRAISACDGSLQWAYARDNQHIYELRWSPDGRWLAVVGFDLLVLDGTSGELHFRLHPLDRSEEVDDVVWSPSARWLLLRTLSQRGDPGTFRVCAATDGEIVATGSIADDDYLGWTDGCDELFSDGIDRLATRSTCITPRFRRSLTYTPDGAHAAAEGEQHVLWIERPTGVQRIDGHPRTITALVLTPHGDVATGCRDGAVRLVLAGTDQLHRLWQMPPGERVEALAWTDDGMWLAVKSNTRVRLISTVLSSCIPSGQ